MTNLNLENINIPENMEFTRWILTDNGDMPAFELKLIDQGKLRKIEFYVEAEYDYNDETGLPEETVIPTIFDDEYLEDDDQQERSDEFMNECVEYVRYADDDCNEYEEGSTTIDEAVQNILNYMSKVSAEDEKLAKETNLEIEEEKEEDDEEEEETENHEEEYDPEDDPEVKTLEFYNFGEKFLTIHKDRTADIEVDGVKTKVVRVYTSEMGSIIGFGIPCIIGCEVIYEGHDLYDLCYEAAKNAKMFEFEKVA